jgi:fructose-1,6-bisphosphatase II
MSLEEAEQPTLDLLAATLAAVSNCWPFVGDNDKSRLDQAAVDAMRYSLNLADFGGVVVIGEGEKDEAPMLFNGERLGKAEAAEWDIAVDPVDGTRLAALGVPGAVSVIAVSPRGTMLDCSAVYYMKKIVSGQAAVGLLDIDYSTEQNIRLLAQATGREASELSVAVIDKPRNAQVIREVQATGATWARFEEGDIANALAAAIPGTGIDLLLGVGGAPEGVVTACAIRALNGFMQGILAPQTPDEIERAMMSGLVLSKKLELTDLVSGDRQVFVMTGITDAPLVHGVRIEDGKELFQSLIIDSNLPEIRRVELSVDV